MNWIEPENLLVPEDLITSIGGHSILSRRLAQLGIHNPDEARAFLDPSFYRSCSPLELPGLGETVDRLEQAISRKEAVLVWGDFDVDGQTATTLLVSLLEFFSLKVDYYIPIREKESHGIHLTELRDCLKNEYQTFISCDTGISAVKEVDELNRLGVDVLITDHHDLPDTLPSARTIVNPHFLPETHPLFGLPGVGVVYQIARELLRRAGNEELCQSYLDLVALGIVADLAKLTGDVRYLLQEGLKIIRQGKRVGLQAIYERLDFDPSGMTEDHIGFLIAPRLNSMGRLGNANPAVELLKTEDIGRARLLVSEIETLNARRRFLTNGVFQGVEAQIRREPGLVDVPVIILESPEWPSGVIGIVASRIVERYGKPTILISTGEGETGRGSARSIDGVNITAALANLGDLFMNYGGHPMAAGFSIPVDKISELKRRITREVEKSEREPVSRMEIDGYIPLSHLTIDLVKDIDRLAPFGPGNPAMVLVSKNTRITSHSKLGRDEEHLRLNVVEEGTGHTQQVTVWHGAEAQLPEGLFDMAYRVRISQYSGRDEVLVEWVDYRQSERERLSVSPREPPKLMDYRREPHPLILLRAIMGKGKVLIWAEGETIKKLSILGIHSCTRDELEPCEVLVVWSIPPGPSELQEVIKTTNPRKIVCFANDPEMDRLEVFLQKLAGIIKYVIRKGNGKVNFTQLGALTAQRESTVRAGLDWMEAHGYVQLLHENYDDVVVVNGDKQSNPEEIEKKTVNLRKSLAETKAFRSLYDRASGDGILNLIRF